MTIENAKVLQERLQRKLLHKFRCKAAKNLPMPAFTASASPEKRGASRPTKQQTGRHTRRKNKHGVFLINYSD